MPIHHVKKHHSKADVVKCVYPGEERKQVRVLFADDSIAEHLDINSAPPKTTTATSSSGGEGAEAGDDGGGVTVYRVLFVRGAV